MSSVALWVASRTLKGSDPTLCTAQQFTSHWLGTAGRPRPVLSQLELPLGPQRPCAVNVRCFNRFSLPSHPQNQAKLRRSRQSLKRWLMARLSPPRSKRLKRSSKWPGQRGASLPVSWGWCQNGEIKPHEESSLTLPKTQNRRKMPNCQISKNLFLFVCVCVHEA